MKRMRKTRILGSLAILFAIVLLVAACNEDDADSDSSGDGDTADGDLYDGVPEDENPCLDMMMFSDQLDGYWGTLYGTANGTEFSLESSLFQFAPKGEGWDLDFQSWDPRGDFVVLIGNLDMFGLGIALKNDVYPGGVLELEVPFRLAKGSGVDSANFHPRVQMTCPIDDEFADVVTPYADVEGSMVIQVMSDDCRDIRFTITITGSDEIIYPEKHNASCSYSATFEGSLDDYPY